MPGSIIASVTEPVYDALTGQTLLIPHGSRLLGSYNSRVAFGQRQGLVVWTRLILPDTSSITLDRLPGVDAAAYAGLEDGVDWHWGQISPARRYRPRSAWAPNWPRQTGTAVTAVS